jgi:putative nucleotidyltransferase with HDIG domain
VRPFEAVRPGRRKRREERLLNDAGCGTRDHSHKVASLAAAIADRLGLHAEERRRVTATARLHDVGKSLLPTVVVDKPGPLTPTEWQIMQLHTVAGERLVSELGQPAPVAQAVRHSHERWDGGGYPDGLRGDEIPLASRIVFCADAYDAICSDRPYRAARSEAESLAEIRRCAGTQFDPMIVEALAEVLRPEIHAEPHGGRRRRVTGAVTAFAAVFAGAILIAVGQPTELPSQAQSGVLGVVGESGDYRSTPLDPGPSGSVSSAATAEAPPFTAAGDEAGSKSQKGRKLADSQRRRGQQPSP